mgnify:CR=1 FL=1
MEEKNELLEHIYKDAYMASYSLQKLLDEIKNKDNKIKGDVEDILQKYQEFKEEIEELLKGNGEEVNDPNFFAKMGSTMGIIKEVKTDNSDSSIADMVIQGVSMGSIETEKKLKAYENDIEKEYKDLAQRFLKFQQKSIDKLKKYL